MPDSERPTPLERAVAREKAAIETHARAAVAEDATASVIEEQAAHESDPERRQALIERAKADRDRADRARARAKMARTRLEDEGLA